MAHGLCPTCGRGPAAFGYSTCQRCRQYRLNRATQKAFDRLVDYESFMVAKGYRRWREIAALLGLSRTSMQVYMRRGAIKTLKDPWQRLWISAAAYLAFKAVWTRGEPLATS